MPHPTRYAAEAADADVVITTYGTAVRDIEALEAVSWGRVVLDEAQAIKNPANDTSQELRRIRRAQPHRAHRHADRERPRRPVGHPRLLQPRPRRPAPAVHRTLSSDGTATKKAAAEDALHTLNGILVFRRTKAEPIIADELPDQIDELDHSAMTPEQIGMYQALLDALVTGADARRG